jgi:hypothetical protein
MSRRQQLRGTNQTSTTSDSLSSEPADVMRMAAAAYRRGIAVNNNYDNTISPKPNVNTSSVGAKSLSQNYQPILSSFSSSYSQAGGSGNLWNSEPSPRVFGSRGPLVQPSQLSQIPSGSQFPQAIFSPSRGLIPLRDTTRSPDNSAQTTAQKVITPIRDPFRSPKATTVTPMSMSMAHSQPVSGLKVDKSSPQSTVFNPSSYARGSGPILEIMTPSTSAPTSISGATSSIATLSTNTGKMESSTPLSITADSLPAKTESGMKSYDLQRLQQRAALNQQLLLDTLILANSVNGTSFDVPGGVQIVANQDYIQQPFLPLSSNSTSQKTQNTVVSPTPSRFKNRREKTMASVNNAKVHIRGGGGGTPSKGNIADGKAAVGYRVLRTLPFLPGPDMKPPNVPPSNVNDLFNSVLAPKGNGKGGQVLASGSAGQRTPDRPSSISLFDLVSQASEAAKASESERSNDQRKSTDENSFLSPMSRAMAPDLPSFFSPTSETAQTEQSEADLKSSQSQQQQQLDASNGETNDQSWVNNFEVSQTFQEKQDELQIQSASSSASSTDNASSNGTIINGRLASFVPSVALYDFEGIKENDEMSFIKGDEVLISQWSHPTWWWGQSVSRAGAASSSTSRGWFPKTYVNLLAPLPTLPPPMLAMQEQSEDKNEGDSSASVIQTPSATSETFNLESISSSQPSLSSSSLSSSLIGHMQQAALYVALPPPRSNSTASRSSEASLESKALSESSSSYDSVIDSDISMQGQMLDLEPKKEGALATLQEPKNESTLATLQEPKEEETFVATLPEPLPIFEQVSEKKNEPIVELQSPPPLTRIASFTEPLYSIGEDEEEEDEDESDRLPSETNGQVKANATAMYLAKTIDNVIAAGAKSSSRRSSISSLVEVQSSTFSGGAHVLDLAKMPKETIASNSSTASLDSSISEQSTNVPNLASITKANEEEAAEENQKTVSPTFPSSYSLPADVLTLLNALHSRGLLKPQQDEGGKGQVTIDADVSELLRLVASAVASTIKREASAGDLKQFAALSEQNSALETKIATIVTKLAKKASFKKSLSPSTVLAQQDSSISPRVTYEEGPQRTLSPSYHTRALSVALSPFSAPVTAETSQAAESTSVNVPSLQRISSAIMTPTTPLVNAPLLRAQRSFFRTPGDSEGGLEELPQLSTDSPGFGIEATIVYSPETSPSAPSSAAMESLLYSEDGRRLKVSTLSGPELFYVFRKKLSGVASVMFVLKRAIKRKRLMKLVGFALMKSWARSVLAKRRAIKVYVLGLAKVAARRRLLSRIATPMAILGSILLPLRERRAELIRRAEAASLGPALLAGLERGLTAADMLASTVSKKNPSSASQSAYTGPKMRGIHWEGLSEDSVKGTIWDTTASSLPGSLQRKDPHSASNPSIDVQQLLPGLFQKFAVADAPPAVSAPSKANVGNSSAASKLTSVLSADVGRLLAISVGSVINRRDLHLLRQALLELDVESLGGADKVQLLANSTVLFDPEKMQPIREYTGDSERLVLPERFVRDIVMTVPAARIRLAVMEFMTIVPELVSSCTTKLMLLRNSVAEVKKSRRFATLLLDVILPLGNRLNAGSRGRSAAGFKISSLHKLMQTRASSGETFLQFVVAGLVERAPKLIDLQLDFPALLQATPQALSRDRVTADIARMEQGVRQTEQLLAQHKSLSAASGPVGTTEAMAATDLRLKAFYNDAISQLSGVRALQAEATAAYEELASWLGEDPSKTTAETLLGFIQVFTQAVAKDAREVKGKLERAANAAKRQQYVDSKTKKKSLDDALNVEQNESESPKLTQARESLSNLDEELIAERDALESLLKSRKGASSLAAATTTASTVASSQTRKAPSKSPESSPTSSPRVVIESILSAGGAAVEAALLEGQKRRSLRRISPLTDLGDSLAEVAETMKVGSYMNG